MYAGSLLAVSSAASGDDALSLLLTCLHKPLSRMTRLWSRPHLWYVHSRPVDSEPDDESHCTVPSASALFMTGEGCDELSATTATGAGFAAGPRRQGHEARKRSKTQAVRLGLIPSNTSDGCRVFAACDTPVYCLIYCPQVFGRLLAGGGVQRRACALRLLRQHG